MRLRVNWRYKYLIIYYNLFISYFILYYYSICIIITISYKLFTADYVFVNFFLSTREVITILYYTIYVINSCLQTSSYYI